MRNEITVWSSSMGGRQRVARIPYADTDRPELRELVERIVQERGQILHLYAMLLNSPRVAEGWLQYLTAIRGKCTLPGRLRELAIIRIAVLNDAPYEAEQHAPIALREGLTQMQLDDIPAWQQSSRFDDIERAVLAYTDAMTRDIHVPDPVFAGVRDHFDAQRVVELTATIAAYNMVSRFLEALQIRSTDPLPGRP